MWALSVATVVGFPPATEGQADRVVGSEKIIRGVPGLAVCCEGRAVRQVLAMMVRAAAGEVVSVGVKDHQLHGQRGDGRFGSAEGTPGGGAVLVDQDQDWVQALKAEAPIFERLGESGLPTDDGFDFAD